jgi:hypothetical protein
MDTDHRFVPFIIPKDRAYDTRIDATAAADAF